MFWIIGLIVTAVIMEALITISIKSSYDTSETACMFAIIDGLVMFVFIIGVIIFSVAYKTRNVNIAKYQQQEKQIVYNLEAYSDNANFCNQFSKAMSDTNDYNLKIVNEQETYKSIGNLFTYRPKEILELPLIDVTKYKVTDSNINMKISK